MSIGNEKIILTSVKDGKAGFVWGDYYNGVL